MRLLGCARFHVRQGFQPRMSLRSRSQLYRTTNWAKLRKCCAPKLFGGSAA